MLGGSVGPESKKGIKSSRFWELGGSNSTRSNFEKKMRKNMVNSYRIQELCFSQKMTARHNGVFVGSILQMGNSLEYRCCLKNFRHLDKICRTHLVHVGKLKIK